MKMRRSREVELHSIGSTLYLRSIIYCVLLIGLLDPTLRAQSEASNSAKNRATFAGTWKGVCQDGKPFALLTLRSASNGIEGTISLGNTVFGHPSGKNGTCTVTDPANQEHSRVIKNAVIEGQKLTFETSSGQQVEMILATDNTARLEVMDSPMQDAIFEVHKTAN
jgi:hypothetical protein